MKLFLFNYLAMYLFIYDLAFSGVDVVYPNEFLTMGSLEHCLRSKLWGHGRLV